MRAWREFAGSHTRRVATTGQSLTPLRPSAAEVEILRGLRIALVHDWLVTLGGSDRVLLALHQLFPAAPVYVSLHDRQRLPEAFQHLDLRTSWLQRLPGTVTHHRFLVPLMPLVFRSLDLRGYEVVLSSSHACAKGVRVDPKAVHICYCHTPMRYAWDFAPAYRQALPPWVRPAAWLAQGWLRRWDRATARRVNHFIANSRFVADRIWRHYGRHATVIHPPVDVDYFTPAGRAEEFFLIASRLVPYKRIDLAVEAFNRLGKPLVVVGDGPEAPQLRAMARSNVTFAGEVSDEDLRAYYRRCCALVFPGVEDFGIAPIEAQSCGRPVIAYRGGGVRESIVDGRTGTLFNEQSVSALIAAVQSFNPAAFDPRTIRRHAMRFSRKRFHRQIGRFVARAYVGAS